MRTRDFPVDDVRRFLESEPIVLVSSGWKGKTNIMTMGWMVMGESSSLVGSFIWNRNHSFVAACRSPAPANVSVVLFDGPRSGPPSEPALCRRP